MQILAQWPAGDAAVMLLKDQSLTGGGTAAVSSLGRTLQPPCNIRNLYLLISILIRTYRYQNVGKNIHKYCIGP